MSNTEVKLSRLIRELLAKAAAPEFQSAAGMADGEVTNGDVIAAQVMAAACMGKEWAIQLVTERTEGKATQAQKDDTNDRSTEEALNDVTRKRLNDLATGGGGNPAVAPPHSAVNAHPEPQQQDRGVDEDAAGPADRAAPSARGLLDLPKDRHRHPKNRKGQSGMASEDS